MISAPLLAQVAEAVCINPAAAYLRTKFPEVHFTECSADDINARCQPVLETEQHEFYLISGTSGHCLEITTEYDVATGIIVAAKADE